VFAFTVSVALPSTTVSLPVPRFITLLSSPP
jgi:hypothetical protein